MENKNIYWFVGTFVGCSTLLLFSAFLLLCGGYMLWRSWVSQPAMPLDAPAQRHAPRVVEPPKVVMPPADQVDCICAKRHRQPGAAALCDEMLSSEIAWEASHHYASTKAPEIMSHWHALRLEYYKKFMSTGVPIPGSCRYLKQ